MISPDDNQYYNHCTIITAIGINTSAYPKAKCCASSLMASKYTSPVTIIQRIGANNAFIQSLSKTRLFLPANSNRFQLSSPTTGTFVGYLPLVDPKTPPPRALLPGFCPWCFWWIQRLFCKILFMRLFANFTTFANHDHGQFCGVFAPGGH